MSKWMIRWLFERIQDLLDAMSGGLGSWSIDAGCGRVSLESACSRQFSCIGRWDQKIKEESLAGPSTRMESMQRLLMSISAYLCIKYHQIRAVLWKLWLKSVIWRMEIPSQLEVPSQIALEIVLWKSQVTKPSSDQASIRQLRLRSPQLRGDPARGSCLKGVGRSTECMP